MKYIFAGDRDIAVNVLGFMLKKGYKPEALMLSEDSRATHASELIALSGLPDDRILHGTEFRSKHALQLFKDIAPEYIIGIHFPYIIPRKVLEIPVVGFLNLHPAYLPYNRGWHTPTWAILDDTPAGATLHFMAEKLDAGDIVHQEQLDISPADTANTLYRRLKDLEFEVFRNAWSQIVALNPNRQPQNLNEGTSYKRKDLFNPGLQELNLESSYKLETLLTKLRALTTNDINEAAFFRKDGKTYRVQISITEEH